MLDCKSENTSLITTFKNDFTRECTEISLYDIQYENINEKKLPDPKIFEIYVYKAPVTEEK